MKVPLCLNLQNLTNVRAYFHDVNDLAYVTTTESIGNNGKDKQKPNMITIAQGKAKNDASSSYLQGKYVPCEI